MAINASNKPRVAVIQEEVQPQKNEVIEFEKAKEERPRPLGVKSLISKKKQGAVKHTISMSPNEWEFLEKLAQQINDSEAVLSGDLEKTTPSEIIRWGISYLIKQKKLSTEELISWRKQKYELTQTLNTVLSKF
ncbi:MAG: hypothetical protein SFU25_04240 [Candidatus Caenarcaniphilales bacterium]|nr:hypothetical protein [Candidatus Caenarcaniphilales bacterium]